MWSSAPAHVNPGSESWCCRKGHCTIAVLRQKRHCTVAVLPPAVAKCRHSAKPKEAVLEGALQVAPDLNNCVCADL